MRRAYRRPKGYQYDGEPRLIMGNNGTTIEVRGGQPVMDSGIENAVMIALFTRPGWFGNYFLDPEYRIGDCNFSDASEGAITASSFAHAEKEAKRGLKWMVDDRLASSIDASVSNPNSMRIDAEITINRPSGTVEQIGLQKYGGSWVRQCDDPANERLTSDGLEE